MSDKHDSGHHPHIIPLWIYMAVGGTLLFMTVVTVASAQVHLGIVGNLILAMVIATFKAGLVAMIFMHLWWDNKLYLYLFLMSLVFLTVFIVFTLFDTMHRGRVYAEKGQIVKPEAVLYSKADIDWVTYKGHHDDHGDGETPAHGEDGHDHDTDHAPEKAPEAVPAKDVFADWQGAHDTEGTGFGSVAAAAVPAGPPPVEGDIAVGQTKYMTCMACHGPDGKGNPALKSPQLVGAQDWYLKTSLQKFHEGLRGSGPGDVFGMQMKAMALPLTEEDMNNVVAYVKTLEVTPPTHTLTEGDAVAGQQKYVTCAACHGPEGKGNPLMKAPSLVHLQDWYVVEQLQKFKKGWRGADAKDPEGMAMRPMAAMLSDDDMVNVAAYIKTLGETSE